jgi:hypothetical protein
MIKLNCEKTILNFELIFSDKTYSKFNIPPPHLKFRNLEKENENASKKSHSSRAFQQYQELTLINFDLKKNFFDKIVQYLITLARRSKFDTTLVHHYSPRAFQ